MKKVISMLVIIFISCFTTKINALKLSQSDYEKYNIKRAYVVGEYIFDLSKHNPTLKDLMLAAQSLPSGSASIIEIKIAENLDGELTREYKELLTNKKLTSFPSLDVKYIYMSEINFENPSSEEKIVLEQKIAYGDVNGDGKVDARDALAIEKHLSPDFDTTLTGQDLKNADVNNDGKVNSVDSNLIARYIAGWFDEELLPNKPITDYKFFGDVDENGSVDLTDALLLLSYLSSKEELSSQGLKNADINDDGLVNQLDSLLILHYDSGWYDDINIPNEPITDYILYGDVNGDNVIDGRDLIRLGKYLNGTAELNEKEMKNADVNGDGTINQIDSDILSKNLNDNEILFSLTPLE